MSVMEDKNILEIYKELKEKEKLENSKNETIFKYIQNRIEIDGEDAFSILQYMNKNQVINYHSVLEKLIKKWKEDKKRPKILLHSCCAPCSTYTLEFLCKYADVTILFANSNIHPKSEYIKRSLAQQKFIKEFNEKTLNNVLYIEDEYNPRDFLEKTIHLKDEKEGGKRCVSCFKMRLDIVANYAKKLNYDYFGSALTLSPKKNSKLINEIGFEMQELFDVKYLPSDFKKNNGYKRSVEMCNEYDVYRQCYCGCIFALKDQKAMEKNK